MRSQGIEIGFLPSDRDDRTVDRLVESVDVDDVEATYGGPVDQDRREPSKVARTTHHGGDPLRRIVPVDFGQCDEDALDVRRRLDDDSDDRNGLVRKSEWGVVDPEEAGLRLHFTSTGDGG